MFRSSLTATAVHHGDWLQLVNCSGCNDLRNALTVLPDRNAGSSDLVIDKIIFDEGAETFEIIPVSGQFSGSPAYDFSAMNLSDAINHFDFR